MLPIGAEDRGGPVGGDPGGGNHPRIAEHGIDHRIIGGLVALGWHASNPDITTLPSTPVGRNRIDADE
jgi:hypothetical protein